jgi:hypothetical protein
VSRRFDGKGGVGLTEIIKYSEPKQLTSGHWYPSRWTDVMTWQRPDSKHVLRREFYLSVDRTLTLGDEWLSDPLKHMRAAPIPAPPAPPATRASTSPSRSK